ncbi:CIC11C00000000796 [Sungouiella intermedia]|uniref:CIC11C00000000796 n=1 Tax=Sungouiella intermedia TaxID=45354 RepID=A0A1L0BIM7_9ASCO|nr:CIC11C00000000796 [[Candida] intermedia]
MSVERRFSLAIERDPRADLDELKEPLSAFLVDSRPLLDTRPLAGRLSSCENVSTPLEADFKPRRYSICDLHTLSNNISNSFDDVNHDATQRFASYSLTSKTWDRNHQRRNSTAIRFLFPKAAELVRNLYPDA